MRIAIVLRGFHYKQETSKTFNNNNLAFDYRNTIHSIKKDILEPLNIPAEDVYVCSYSSPIDSTLGSHFNAANIFLQNAAPGLTQCVALYSGLDRFLPELEKYDRVFILRFDFVYKAPITKWAARVFEFGGDDGSKLWLAFPMRENALQFIADTIFAIGGGGGGGGDGLRQFINTLKDYTTTNEYRREPTTLHYIGPMLPMPVNFIVADGHFYDTNTSYDARPECKNPIYVMYGRDYYFDDYPSQLT